MIYERIIEELNRKEVRYLVVGGVAMVLYGYGRLTADLDLFVDLDSDNLDKLAKALYEYRYKPYIPVEIEDLKDEKIRRSLIKEKNMLAFRFWSEEKSMRALCIDIIIYEPIPFEKAYENKTVIKIHNVNIPVIAVEDLIEMKRKSNRNQDILDIKWLEQSKE